MPRRKQGRNKRKEKEIQGTQVATIGTSTTPAAFTSTTSSVFSSTTASSGISSSVTEPIKTSNAGLIAGATIVAALFLFVATLVVYMFCCRCKKDHPRKNSTYQMYSEVDASQMVIPGNLRTINSPLYGTEDTGVRVVKETPHNSQLYRCEIDNVYDEIVDNPVSNREQACLTPVR